MYTNKIVTSNLFLLILVVLLFMPNYVSAFQITYPEPNSTVKGEVIEIEGKGAIPGATIEISVLTNKWYLQDGKAEIDDNGDWSYAPCYLSGRGENSSHTIKARLIQNGKPIETRGGPRKSDRLLRWSPDIKTKGICRYDKKKKPLSCLQGKGCIGGSERRKNVIRAILTIRGSCEPDQHVEEAIIEGFA